MTEAIEWPFSLYQQKILYYAPKPFSLASIACSIFIIQKILRDQKRRSRVYHRIILALSFHTIILCLAIFFRSLPIPKDSLTNHYGANGTEIACTFQGFVLIFESITVSSFYLSLSLFSFLAVRNNFNEKILRNYERLLHTGIYLTPLAFACVALDKKYINPSIGTCYISAHPVGCSYIEGRSCNHGDSGIETYAMLNSLYFFLTFIVAVVLMISLYFYVRQKEKSNERLHGKQKYIENARKLKSRTISTQAGLYFGAFILTYFFPVYCRADAFYNDNYNFSAFLLGSLMMSFHGVVHLIVYQRLLRRPKDNKGNNLPPLEKRILETSRSDAERRASTGTCHEKLFCSADKPEFSIFDGTNASELWGKFIDPPSDSNDENELEDEKKQNDKNELSDDST